MGLNPIHLIISNLISINCFQRKLSITECCLIYNIHHTRSISGITLYSKSNGI